MCVFRTTQWRDYVQTEYLVRIKQLANKKATHIFMHELKIIVLLLNKVKF